MIKKVCFSFVLMLWCMAAMAQQVNVGTGEDAPTYFSTNAQWTFAGKWDPEKRIRDLWSVLAY